MGRGQRAAGQQVRAIRALDLVQHDVLHAAIGSGIELVDHEIGPRGTCRKQHDSVRAKASSAHESILLRDIAVRFP